METRTVIQEVTFDASPREVFQALTDSKIHAEVTGEPTEIDARPGGRFSVNGGNLGGTTLELRPSERIVQRWRDASWPPGVESQLTILLRPVNNGSRTQLSLTQDGVPAKAFDEINAGWSEFYWQKMATFFRARRAGVVERFVAAFKNKQALAIVDEFYAPDCVLHLPVPGLPPGREGQKVVGQMVFAAFSDLKATTNDVVVEGDFVVERGTVVATHKGNFFGHAPTGKRLAWTENHIYRLSEEGKIAEQWSETSCFMALLEQARAVAPEQSAPSNAPRKD